MNTSSLFKNDQPATRLTLRFSASLHNSLRSNPGSNPVGNPGGDTSSGFSAEATRDAAEELVKKLGIVLGLHVPEIDIEIYDRRSDWIDNHTVINEADLYTWVSGDAGRLIRILADPEKVTSQAALEQIVCHECVHFLVRSVAGERLPAWLDEGLALHFVHTLPGAYRKLLQQALQQEATLPLELLTDPFTRFDRQLKSLAYAQAAGLVDFLVAERGYPAIAALLADCRKTTSLDALLRPLSFTGYLLESQWRSWAAGRAAEPTSAEEPTLIGHTADSTSSTPSRGV